LILSLTREITHGLGCIAGRLLVTHSNVLDPRLLGGHSYLQKTELGTRSFFQGSLSAPHSIFSHGSLTLMRSFFEFPFSLVAQTLVAQPVVR
jgi:hypothetical protein